MVLSAPAARSVADDFAVSVGERWPAEIVAVVLIGSLGAGDYVPGRSDIDTVVVVRDGVQADAISRELAELAVKLQREYEIPKGFGVVVLRHRQLSSVPNPDDELAPEILDIKQRGRVLAGSLDLAAIRTPTEHDLRTYCERFIPWLRQHRREHRRLAPDANVNGLLYELRYAVFLLTGRYVLRKPDVVPALIDADPTLRDPLLDRIHDYVSGDSAAPANISTDRLRDHVELYYTELADWLSTEPIVRHDRLFHYALDESTGIAPDIRSEGLRPLSDLSSSDERLTVIRGLYEAWAAPVVRRPNPGRSGVFLTPIDFRRLPGSMLYARPRVVVPVQHIDPRWSCLTYQGDYPRTSLPVHPGTLLATSRRWTADGIRRWFGADRTKLFFHVPQVIAYQTGSIKVEEIQW